MAPILNYVTAVAVVSAPLYNIAAAHPLEGDAAPLEERGLNFGLPIFPNIKIPSISIPGMPVPTIPSIPALSSFLPNKPIPFAGPLVTGSVIASGTTLAAGDAIPTGVYNPNGPYFNPNDYTPLPFTWPGKPTAPNQAPPPRPTKAPFSLGGLKAASYQSPSWIVKGLGSLIPGLAQTITNGKSLFGLIDCPRLPPWLGGNPPLTACSAMPNTGVTRHYDFTVAYQKIAPDGVVKNGLTVNGQFPGPLIEANWGDTIQIKVTNNLTDEGTSLHWHGILQTGTPFYDGVPSVSQCPIAPGKSLTYTFKADLHGSSWYHSHYSAQYAGGALGPMIIHGPKFADYDEDLGPVLLSDWYHQDYFTLVNQTMHGGVPVSNNNLINGKMNYPCVNTTLACTPNAGVSKFSFAPGKKYRLRLINASGEGIQKFSIDGHTMTVIQNDFVPVKPYTTNVVTLGVGQRSDVIVQAVGKAGSSYWMRANLGTLGAGCSVTDGVSPEGLAAVYYTGANTNSVPTTVSTVTAAQIADCGNDPLSTTVALCALTPDPKPPTTETITITFGSNGTNFVWFMNGSSFRGNYNDPNIIDAHNGDLAFPPEYNVHNFGSNSSVRLIIKNTFQFGAHPMHVSTSARTTLDQILMWLASRT